MVSHNAYLARAVREILHDNGPAFYRVDVAASNYPGGRMQMMSTIKVINGGDDPGYPDDFFYLIHPDDADYISKEMHWSD